MVGAKIFVAEAARVEAAAFVEVARVGAVAFVTEAARVEAIAFVAEAGGIDLGFWVTEAAEVGLGLGVAGGLKGFELGFLLEGFARRWTLSGVCHPGTSRLDR